MQVLQRTLFRLAYMAKRPSVLRYYEWFQKSQWMPLEHLRQNQEEQLQHMVAFAYHNVPYYTKVFDKIGVRPSAISTIRDLEKLPILTKQVIRKQWRDFLPRNVKELKYTINSTGGSTGEPLKYRISDECYSRGVALQMRGWGYAGYRLGDKVLWIGGGSLIPTTFGELRKRAIECVLNRRYLSSFDMSPDYLGKYAKIANTFKPDFIYGYASSVYLLAKFILNQGLQLSFRPKAVFTSSEKLLPQYRKVIAETFDTEVFDCYSLNDGGASAYECQAHRGLHLDMERAVIETVDESGRQVYGRVGRILATSLYNYAHPFIRYDTGDLGVISMEPCACGRHLPILCEIIGRTTDTLKLNNVLIGSPVLTVLFGKIPVEQYQIVQTGDADIICKIVKGAGYSKKHEDFIRRSFAAHAGKMNIHFEYVPHIIPQAGNKHKFIINLVQK